MQQAHLYGFKLTHFHLSDNVCNKEEVLAKRIIRAAQENICNTEEHGFEKSSLANTTFFRVKLKTRPHAEKKGSAFCHNASVRN